MFRLEVQFFTGGVDIEPPDFAVPNLKISAIIPRIIPPRSRFLPTSRLQRLPQTVEAFSRVGVSFPAKEIQHEYNDSNRACSSDRSCSQGAGSNCYLVRWALADPVRPQNDGTSP